MCTGNDSQSNTKLPHLPRVFSNVKNQAKGARDATDYATNRIGLIR